MVGCSEETETVNPDEDEAQQPIYRVKAARIPAEKSKKARETVLRSRNSLLIPPFHTVRTSAGRFFSQKRRAPRGALRGLRFSQD
jgi:hypothetical protein